MQKVYSTSLTFLLLFMLCIPGWSQSHRNCGTTAYIEQQIANHPEQAAQRAAIQRQMQAMAAQYEDILRTGDTIFTIPVVVHIVWNTADQNLPDSQVISQIDVLNEDFRRLNADTVNTPNIFKPIAADIGVEFCLANYDPDGNQTTGITRTQTMETSFGTDDAIKFDAQGGKDAWPANQYLNVWVGPLGGGLLGYASSIGGGGDPAVDGIVCTSDAFGRNSPKLIPEYDMGRTATHEVGHWMGLRHVWGDGDCTVDDGVSDTPIQEAPNYGCPQIQSSCGNDMDGGDQFMNYMDYSDDICFNMFSEGQKVLMRATLAPGGNHRPLLSSNACVNPAFNNIGMDSLVVPYLEVCGGDFIIEGLMSNYGQNVVTEADIQVLIDGIPLNTFTWNGNMAVGGSAIVTYNPPTLTTGLHTITLITQGANGGFPDPDNTNDTAEHVFLVLDNQGDPVPYGEGFELSVYPPADWEIVNPDGDKTWEKTNLAARFGSSCIRMNNFDYSAVGEVDELVMKDLDVSGLTSVGLSFWLSYAKFGANTGFSDTLEVWASVDCGQTYDLLYKKFGGALETTTPTPGPFVPQSDWQWRKEWVDLTPYAGATGLTIKFRHTTNYENNLYLDNINLTEIFTLPIGGAFQEISMEVFPNPASDILSVQMELLQQRELDISLVDLQGKVVWHKAASVPAGNQTVEIPVNSLASGLYLLDVRADDKRSVHKVRVE